MRIGISGVRRVGLRAGAALLLTAGVVAGLASPASAVIPADCGPFSGTMGAGFTVYDFSASAVPIGTLAAPYFVPAVANPLVVGSLFNDVIVGTALDDAICGLAGADVIEGRAGDDELYGGPDPDIISGQENSDFISGAEGDDYLYGDQPVPTVFDTGDTVQGGTGDDHLYGGAFPDILKGGPNTAVGDYADGGPSMQDSCLGIEQATVNCP